MRNIDLANVEAPSERKQLTPGGYVGVIMSAIDVPDKEYLKIEYDIATGPFQGYYTDLFTAKGFWAGKFNKSYKEKALPFFKSFITAVEESNKNFKWNNDETQLKGKFIGLVLGEEEYKKNDGSTGTRLYVHQTRSVDAIGKGQYKVPDKKYLPQEVAKVYDLPDDDDLPDFLK